MRLFKIIILNLFLALNIADAAPARWISVEANHANLLYSEGEKAKFRIRTLVKPGNPNFKLVIEAEHIGQGAPIEIELHEGYARFETVALQAGTQSIRFRTRLVGEAEPPEMPYEQEVENRFFELSVIH